MREDLCIFDDEVSKFVLGGPDDEININSPELIPIREKLKDVLTPVEVKITKSKEGGKGMYRFVLFCKENTKIYNTVAEYLSDAPQMSRNSMALSRKIDDMTHMAISSATTTSFDFDSEDSVAM
jgi:hypothetical protein